MAKVALNEICEILNGYAFKSEKYVDSGVRIIRITNVQKGYVEDEKPQFYSEEDMINHQEYMLREDDLLISLTGNVGRVALLEKCFLPAALNQRVACLRTKSDKVNKKYVFYALLSKKFENDCIASAKGIAQKNMSTEWVKQYKIEFPDTDKQQEIVDLMDRLSSVIDSRKQELEELDNLTKSRFLEMFGDIESNPHEWGKVTVGSIVKSCEAGWSGNGKQRERRIGEKAVLKVSAVTKGYFIPEECKVLDNQDDIKKYVFPEKGDLLFSRANTREMVGATAIILEDYPELILPDKLWKIRFNDKANVFYMKFALSSASVRAKISAASTGTSGSMYNVSMDKFKGIEILIPPIELQKKFAAFVAQVDKLKFRKGGTVMCKFVIKNAFYRDKSIAYLYYDENKKEYEIEVLDTTKSQEAPLIIADFIKKNQRNIGNEWSKRWVQQRVTPPERQNLGQVLKANNMKEYDEFKLLVKNEGRSCQDECYIVAVEE